MKVGPHLIGLVRKSTPVTTVQDKPGKFLCF